MTLRAPPKPPHATASLVGRFVGLIVLLCLFAGVVWVAATNQQVPLVERRNPLVSPPGEHVAAGGEVIHVRIFGSGGPTVVLVHDDSIAGGGLLEPLAEELAAQGRTVVVPDLVGFGLSARPEDPGRGYSSIGQAETLADYLATIETATVEVAGFGWGGIVAADLAITAPDVVQRLVLVDVPTLTPEATGWHTLEALPFGVGRAVSYTREGAGGGAEEIFRQTCPGPADCNDPAVVESYRRASQVPGTAASIRARRASADASVAADRIDELDEGSIELVATGDADAMEDVAALFGDLAVTVADSRSDLVAALAGP